MPPFTAAEPPEVPPYNAMSSSLPSAIDVGIPIGLPKASTLSDGQEPQPETPSPASPVTSTGSAPDSPWGQRALNDELVNKVGFDWLKELTRRMDTVENKLGHNEAHDDAGSTPVEKSPIMQVVPEVRDCNWESFKNRYSSDGGIPAIETLLAGHDLDRDMEKEQLKRLDFNRRNYHAADEKPKRTQTGKTTDTKRIERVRINSPAVLSLLAEVTGQESWHDYKPLTFLRPFKTFIHFHGRMEKELEKLKSGISDTQAVLATSEGGIPEEVASNTGLQQTTELRAAEQAWLEIKCYVTFVSSRILPIYHKFDRSADVTRTKVRFTELGSLFHPGDLIFESADSKTNQTKSSTSRGPLTVSHSSGRRVWRVYMVDDSEIDWVVDSLDVVGGTLRRNRNVDDVDEDFNLGAYRIDYDGNEYAAAPAGFCISPFEGEKEITKLAFYPARFQRDSDNLINVLRDRGKRFQRLMGYQRRAIEHDGWTLPDDPSGERLPGHVSGYIASDVIIDFEEAYQRHPTWKPDTRKYDSIPWSPVVKHDLFPVIQWSSNSRSEEISRINEVVVENDDVSELEWYEFGRTDNFIVNAESLLEVGGVTRQNEGHDAKQELTDEDLALLPGRLFVYSLRDRKFVNADIRCLKLPTDIPDPFEELKIPLPDKELIRSMVRDHFEKKKIQRQLESLRIESYEQDFIPGKGKGLVILLHGAPGVGKTATAEAVAYAHQKPLFPITCGDLGTDPETVERTLSDIFRLASLWDCVLLLDEAEIFLSRREKMDDNLQRNALVSIFLRTLEYYPGILFLTTNRVGVLDEALNSRVHISLFFRHLDIEQTKALFAMNLRRCKVIAERRASVTKEPTLTICEEEILVFAVQQYNYHVQGNSSMPWWNGRQIRNAFQIASSLAYEETTAQPKGSPKHLGREHFEQILRAIDDYAEYRRGVHRKTEEELAHERFERSLKQEFRPDQGQGGRPQHRRSEAQQEMAGSQSPYAYQQQQYQPPVHLNTMSTPTRTRDSDYNSPHSDSMAYGARSHSRPGTESFLGPRHPEPQGDMLLHSHPVGSPDNRGYGHTQYGYSEEYGRPPLAGTPFREHSM